MQDKKSFILYCDIITTIEKLSDEQAGQLFKIILQYVNDKNPEVRDLLLQIAFEPIRNQLKRDLIKWDEERHQRSEAGKKGMKERWKNKRKTKDNAVINPITNDNKNNTVINPITNITDNVNVTVTETVNDNETVNVNAIDGACISLQKFFGFESEIKYLHKQKEIDSFVRRLYAGGQLDYFITQFQCYRQYKEISKDKIHGFQSFINGGWEADNWEQKLNIETLKKDPYKQVKEQLKKQDDERERQNKLATSEYSK